MLKIETNLIPMRGHEIHPSDFIKVACILALFDLPNVLACLAFFDCEGDTETEGCNEDDGASDSDGCKLG